MYYLLRWVWIETKMCSITNLFIPHAAWTGWQTVSHLIFHTRYRERPGQPSGQPSGQWVECDSYQTVVTAGNMIGHLSGSRHCGVTADTLARAGGYGGRPGGPSYPIPHPIPDVSGRERAIVRQTRLSQWALFWLSGSCPNKYSNMAIVGVRFSNGNVIWAKCD